MDAHRHARTHAHTHTHSNTAPTTGDPTLPTTPHHTQTQPLILFLPPPPLSPWQPTRTDERDTLPPGNRIHQQLSPTKTTGMPLQQQPGTAELSTSQPAGCPDTKTGLI